MKFSCTLLCFIVLLSCKGNADPVKTFQRDGFTIKGRVINDSVFNDTMYYYNSNQVLVSKKYYKAGIQTGVATDYADDGSVSIVSNFSDGKLNGLYTIWSASGVPEYSAFFYYGLPAGPILYYKDGKPKRFFFSDLNNQDLCNIYYPEWKGVAEITKDLVNYSINTMVKDTVKQTSVFLYLIRPPRLAFNYSLVRVAEEDFGKEKIVREFTEEMPFVSFSIPVLKDTADAFAIKLSVYDSILNKASVIYRNIE